METCEKCNNIGIVYEKDGSSHTCFDCLNSGKLNNTSSVKQEQSFENNSICAKCHSTGIVKEANGQTHTCWDCLQSGRLDNHSRTLPEHNIKL